MPNDFGGILTAEDFATPSADIHDIRAKAATDARAQGLDSKSLLGHASESAHLRYLRGKETPVA
jgi:hypothetical protein